MATYKGIQGYSVQKLATDPTASETVGQLWYNSTSGAFKISTEGAGAWSAGVAYNSGRQYIVGAGTNTAGIIFGGSPSALTETFDGSTWTAVNSLNAAVSQSGGATSGTSTATLSFGMPSGNTETWNGTCWSEGSNMGTGRYTGQASGGTATAAIAMGGPPSGAKTEIYDGTSWSDANDQIASRGEKAGCGSTTSAVTGGGRPPEGTGIAEKWDGTCWSVTGTMNTGRYYQSAAGDSGTAALMFAGIPPPSGLAVTESFNGSTWTEEGDLSAASAYGGGGVGNSSAATMMSTGAPVGGSPTRCEVWNDPVYAIKTVTVS